MSTRKRPFEQAPQTSQVFAQKIQSNRGISTDDEENVHSPLEKRSRTQARPRVCLKCLAGEGGHITHILQEMPI
ncbi:unnamed protein product, partial [Mesorhabditis belari]|uniref:Uncharacterized protein n=1 Tax=Mesorhabditis belari TaxID=2138241 RepID=A0AAF3FR08_9BILA